MKKKLAFITMIVAVLFGIGGFIVPPTAVLDASILWLISQFLLYSSACLGLDIDFRNVFQKGEK